MNEQHSQQEAQQSQESSMVDNAQVDDQTIFSDTSPIDNISENPAQLSDDSQWFWQDGQPGEGERPEWLKSKYKNVAEQAKAYVNAESKLGSFSGAPEEYEVEVPEEYENLLDINVAGESFKEFEDLARENNMSQELFEKCINANLKAFNEVINTPLSEEEVSQYKQSEMQKLGPNAPQVIQQLNQWSENNLSKEDAAIFNSFGSTADGVRLLHSIINKTSSRAVANDVKVNTGFSSSELAQGMASERYHLDKEFRKQIDQAYIDKYS